MVLALQVALLVHLGRLARLGLLHALRLVHPVVTLHLLLLALLVLLVLLVYPQRLAYHHVLHAVLVTIVSKAPSLARVLVLLVTMSVPIKHASSVLLVRPALQEHQLHAQTAKPVLTALRDPLAVRLALPVLLVQRLALLLLLPWLALPALLDSLVQSAQ